MYILPKTVFILTLYWGIVFCSGISWGDSVEPIQFSTEEGRLIIRQNGYVVAEYVFADPKIPRPYFTRLCAPNGMQVTRNHPPIAGQDATDHDLLHPGVWIAFGDINGVDFWRNKGRVEHVRFIHAPSIKDEVLTFAIEEKFLDGNNAAIGRGVESFYFAQGNRWGLTPDSFLLLWQMKLSNDSKDLTFGPQHEMGLGFRVTTPITVKSGNGTISSSHGGVNEKGNWGKTASWWDYSGTIKEHHAGILAVADINNPRPVWSHARDYGFIAINPTGVPAKNNAPSESFVIPAGETFCMRFGLMFYSSAQEKPNKAANQANLIQQAFQVFRAE